MTGYGCYRRFLSKTSYIFFQHRWFHHRLMLIRNPHSTEIRNYRRHNQICSSLLSCLRIAPHLLKAVQVQLGMAGMPNPHPGSTVTRQPPVEQLTDLFLQMGIFPHMPVTSRSSIRPIKSGHDPGIEIHEPFGDRCSMPLDVLQDGRIAALSHPQSPTLLERHPAARLLRRTP